MQHSSPKKDTRGLFKCDECPSKFGFKSNLERHKKVHKQGLIYKCQHCVKVFAHKHGLDRHLKIHLYPTIPMYKAKEAQLRDTESAIAYAKNPNVAVDNVWLSEKTAEEKAKQLGGDLWPACVVLTWGKYKGQNFKWLLENAVGWTVWLLSEYILNDDKAPLSKWQKQTLLDFCQGFEPITAEIKRRLAKSRKRPAIPEAKYQKMSSTATSTVSSVPPSTSTSASADEITDAFAEDNELLCAAEEELGQSSLFVKTTMTTVGKFIKQTQSQETPSNTDVTNDPELSLSSGDYGPIVYEGWHKHWEVATTHGTITPNIRWMRDNLEHGLFLPSRAFKNQHGDIVLRKVLKDRMDFNPPPLPLSMMGSVPNMLSFFTSPVFFWRPVGVMKLKIRCPNSNCPAASKPDAYLIRKGYGSTARQVCSLQSYYTLLTERLSCVACSALRKSSQSASVDSDTDDEDSSGQQHCFLGYSPRILMNLSPAVRSMFPAVICGKRAIDKSVVSLLEDKINSVSMSKVQRLVQQGHDRWYMERRDLYQTLLYEAHTAKGASGSHASGILSFVRQPGSYTPPIPKPSLPSARVLRRAHLLLEMEKMPDYRASILSVTGEILCIDGTKQVLSKLTGDGQGTMQYVTSILNEWGQFLTTVVVASESEGSYRRLAKGLVSRFRRAGAPAPKIIYADNNCCRDGSSSFLEVLFKDWVDEGMLVRLDIRHWLHRWDKVVIKQTHSKYGTFMSAMAGAVLAYNRTDMMELVHAVRSGNEELYSGLSNEQMIRFVTSYQLKSYVRRVTRGVEETACTIERILEEFKGPAGNDVDGIPLFKSNEAVDTHWQLTASKHLSCMQDPPGVQLYVVIKEVVINGVTLKKYRCRRGSNSLEGLHAHLNSAIPTQCGLIPFQVYLLAFANQWNSRMESLRVAGGQGRVSSCTDPRLIQRLNQQAEFLFGKEHVFEPNFVAPMPSDSEGEKELLGIEYAQCQSTGFTPKDYYADHVEEEQNKDGDGDGEEDEGIIMEEGEEESSTEPIEGISCDYAVLTQSEQITENDSPVLQDVLAPSHLHLPGFEEVEALALALLQLAVDGDQHIVSATVRQNIHCCFDKLKDHDKSVRKFVKKYESKWGYSLFGRCLGPDSEESSAAQKTKFAKRYAPAQPISEDSRLLYLIIKMLRNRPPSNTIRSPTKQASKMLSVYKRIVDRVIDDPILSGLNLPLPNINAKSITTFLTKQDKKANFAATQVPRAKPRQTVVSDAPLPDAIHLPYTLTATREEIQYPVLPHVSGKRHHEKRRLDFDDPVASKIKATSSTAATAGAPVMIRPRPCVSTDRAPILLVTPSQPQGPSVLFGNQSLMLAPPPKPQTAVRVMPGKSGKPCAACGIPQCGGKKKRYTVSVGDKKKIFTYCPTTRKSTTASFDKVQYEDYEHFKRVVNEKLNS